MSQPETPSKTSAITNLLLEDHQHMDAKLQVIQSMLHEVCKRQSEGALKTLQETMRQLIQEMNTHTACEELALFPALANHHPMPVMEVEHDEMKLMRTALQTSVLNYSFPEDCTGELYQQGMEFIDQLRAHWVKEENAIFPLAEKSLTPAEKYEVLAKMEDLRATAKVIPTPEIQHAEKQFHTFHLPLNEPISEKISTALLLESDGFQLKSVELQAGASLANHWSTRQVILLLCNGEAKWSSGNHQLPLQVGDGVLMAPKLPHAIEAMTNCRFFMISRE